MCRCKELHKLRKAHSNVIKSLFSFLLSNGVTMSYFRDHKSRLLGWLGPFYPESHVSLCCNSLGMLDLLWKKLTSL